MDLPAVVVIFFILVTMVLVVLVFFAGAMSSLSTAYNWGRRDCLLEHYDQLVHENFDDEFKHRMTRFNATPMVYSRSVTQV